MKKPLISIIIPVYNVEAYIEECLVSILNQTIQDIEVIIVDDCSPANEEAIIRQYLKKDNRIKYIKNDVNQGPGITRNKGFALANGQYCGCIDGDDYIAPDMYEKLYNNAKKNNTDFSWCNFMEFKNGTTIFEQKKLKKEFIDDYLSKIFTFQDIGNYLWLSNIFISPCNKIYKTDFFKKHIKFDEKVFYEDVVPHYQAWLNATRISFVNEYLYYYRTSRLGSTMTSTYTEEKKHHTDDMIRYLKKVIDLFKQKELYDEYERDLLVFVIGTYNLVPTSKYRYDNFRELVKGLNIDAKKLKSYKIKTLNVILQYSFEEKEKKRKLLKPFRFIRQINKKYKRLI